MKLLIDKSSARTTDAQGFLHVAGCNISKAVVSPYRGSEIPDWQERGLEAGKVYFLLRTPDELEKAASTFNNLPLLDVHVEVGAVDFEDPEIKKHIVGSTGTDATWTAPHLQNSLVIWTAGAIAGIDSKEQTELSCAYRYELDMTPGEFEGQKYDGRMLNIIGNHVALVEEGRAGRDVVVADHAMAHDSKPTDIIAVLNGAKASIESTLKPGIEGERAKILDDCTSAIDSAVHHLLDFDEEVVAKPAEDIAERKDATPAAGVAKYGEVKFADTINNKYPIDTAPHVRAALSYWGRLKTRNKYSKKDQEVIQGRINAAAKKFKLGSTASDNAKPADSKEALMGKAAFKLTPRGQVVKGALISYLAPKLAEDKALVPNELDSILKRVRASHYTSQIPGIVGTVKDRFTSRLAADEEMDPEEMEEMLEELEEEGEGEDAKVPAPAVDEDLAEDSPGEKLMALLGKCEIPEEMLTQMNDLITELSGKKPAEDEKPEFPAKKEEAAMPEVPITKPAMDAALKAERQSTIAEVGARYEAAEAVLPFVGKINVLVADSAAAVYKLALDAKGISTEGVDPSAFKAMVGMLTVETPAKAEPTIAVDKAMVDDFNTKFPHVAGVKKL